MDQRSRRVPHGYPPGPVPDGEMNDPTSRLNSAPLNPGPSIQQQDRRPGSSDFLATVPGLRIFQLNVEGLSASKRSLIEELVTKHDIDVICLQETHIEDDVASRFSITGYDLLHYTLHPKFGRATYIRSDLTDASCVQSHPHCDIIRLATSRWRMSTDLRVKHGPRRFSRASLTQLSLSGTSTVSTRNGDTLPIPRTVSVWRNGQILVICTWFTTPNRTKHSITGGGIPTPIPTCIGVHQ